MLILKTVNGEMKAYGGFLWPESGPVQCDDWDPAPRCGDGLHGLPWGEGNGSLLNWDSQARWLVLEAEDSEVVVFDNKCKCKQANVVYCGDRVGSTEYIRTHGGADRMICGATATAGYRGTATAGYGGTATAGYGGTATAGYRGTATAGDGGTATAGDGGTATAGYGGTATAGYDGTATAGYGGTATAGDRGTATAGYGGTATAGDRGIIMIHWWDGERYRISVGYCEEDIKADQGYQVDEHGKFIELNETGAR